MEKQIYYHDTDAGGVVYYANYLKFMEEARTQLLQKNGLLKEFDSRGFIFAVVRCDIAYRSPARYGDVIVTTARLTKASAVQVRFRQEVLLKSGGQTLAEADVTLACLDKKTFKPSPIPADLKNQLVS